jgi:hypothetical protein
MGAMASAPSAHTDALVADAIPDALLADAASDLDEKPIRAENQVALAAWRRLVKKAKRVRRLQAIWGNLGQHLQTFDGGIRDRLRALYPKSG